jgi:hypothetical protein
MTSVVHCNDPLGSVASTVVQALLFLLLLLLLLLNSDEEIAVLIRILWLSQSLTKTKL